MARTSKEAPSQFQATGELVVANETSQEAAIRKELLRKITYGSLIPDRYGREELENLPLEALEALAKLTPTSYAEAETNPTLTLNARVEHMREENDYLHRLFERASSHPANIVIAAQSDTFSSGVGHEPTESAVKVANARQIGHVTLMTADSVEDAEKIYWTQQLGGILKTRTEVKLNLARQKADKILTEREWFMAQGSPEEHAVAMIAYNKECENQARVVEELEQALIENNFPTKAREIISGPYASIYLAALMTAAGQFEAIVGGGDASSGAFLSALFYTNPHLDDKIRSAYVMSGRTPSKFPSNYSTSGIDGAIYPGTVIAFTDPAVQPSPSPEDRAKAAFYAAQLMERLLPQDLYPGVVPRIGFESYATGPSATGNMVSEDSAAYAAYRRLDSTGRYAAFGPLQADASFNRITAEAKKKEFERAIKNGTMSQEQLDAYLAVAGQVNVFSMSNLEAANPIVKFVNAMWEAVEQGPLLLPTDLWYADRSGTYTAADLSRGALGIDILATLATMSVLYQTRPQS